MVRFTCKSSASLVAESTRQTRSMTRRQQKAIPPVFTEDAVKPVKTNPRSKKSSNKRATTQRRAAKLQSAVRAGKQTVVKSKAKKRRAGPSFVYVGNLQAGVHEQRLHSVFSKYGEISKISIRCSGGQVITIGTPIPSSARGSKDILYAAIEFYDSDAGRKSFEADGYILDGEPLVVTSCAANLPELKAILKSRGAQPKAQVVSKMAQREGLKTQATEPCFATEEVKSVRDRVRIFGFSFAVTVV